MSRTRWQALLRSAKSIHAVASTQSPVFGQVAVAAAPLAAPKVVSAATSPRSADDWAQSADFLRHAAEAAFAARQDAEPDPIAGVEREVIRAVWDPAGHHQAIPQFEGVAGLLAEAGSPRWSDQAEMQTAAMAGRVTAFLAGS